MKNDKPRINWSDFLALCMATYQLLMPVVIVFILSIIAVYFVLRLIYM